MSSGLEVHEVSLGEHVPDAAVEHTSAKVDALVPRLHHEHTLMVDKLLIIGVVGIDDLLTVWEVEEVVKRVDNVVEVVVGVVAVGHRSAEVILCVKHVLVAALVVFVAVVAVRADELGIEFVSLLRALEKLVSRIHLLVGVGVEEAGGPKRGGIFAQIGGVDVRAKVQLL